MAMAGASRQQKTVARKLGSSFRRLPPVDFSGDDDGSWLFLRFGPGVSGLDFFCTKRALGHSFCG